MFNKFVDLAFIQHKNVPDGFAAILASPRLHTEAERLQTFVKYFLKTRIGIPLTITAGAGANQSLERAGTSSALL